MRTYLGLVDREAILIGIHLGQRFRIRDGGLCTMGALPVFLLVCRCRSPPANEDISGLQREAD